MSRVLVIGLDGASWDLIKPLTEGDGLPRLKKLMEKGGYGNLESSIPPFTGPAWVSFATGKNPGKHGCSDFLLPNNSLNDLKTITAKYIHGTTFYEILNGNGKKCILINLPGTYPPRIKEVIISSLLTPGDDFIFPPDLINEVPEFKDYRIFPDVSLAMDGKIIEYVNDIRKLERTRFECAKKLFKKDWDFFFLLFGGTDWIQHELYDKLVSGMIRNDSDPMKLYKEIDEYIGWFIDNMPQNVNILLMSDHGFKAYTRVFYINGWLRGEGYLNVEPTRKSKTQPHRLMMETEKVQHKKLNIKLPISLLKSFVWMAPLYLKLKKKLPIVLRADVQPKLSETIACSITSTKSNFGGVYINDKRRFSDGKVETDIYENVREEIMNKLKQLKDPKTKENVIKNVWKKEDIYFGDQLDIAPDIAFMTNEYQVRSGISFTKSFENKVIEKNSGHALDGIFLGYGPDIAENVKMQNANICDIAPTILHLLGLPIPADMDGRVLKEIFREDSEPAKREIKYHGIEDGNENKKRLRNRIKKLKDCGRI